MELKKLNKILIASLILMVGIGCKKEGPIEKAGSRVDEVVDNVKDGDPPLKEKGAAEKAGEAIDDAVDPDSH